MPVVTVQILRGKSSEQKAEVAKAITSVLHEKMGVAPAATSVIFQEVERADWCNGGTMMSER